MKRLLLAAIAALVATAAFATPVVVNDTVTYIDGTGHTQEAPVVTVSKLASPYQVNQTALVAGSGNVANATAAATLTGTASTTVYLAGFEMTAAGATAALPVTCTLTGLLGGTRSLTFDFPAGVLVGATPLQVEFLPALPAAAVNTPIVASCPAGGAGNTNATMMAHGFYQ